MDSDQKAITEDSGIHESWYAEAGSQTLKTLPSYLRSMLDQYEHDYGTICHALAAGAIATAYAMNKHEQGGITGFQAGEVMWQFVRHWNYRSNKCGLRIVDYDDMLYPQFAYKFMERTIPRQRMDVLQQEAKRNLKESPKANPEVLKHWQSLADGQPPFGYSIKD